MAAALKLIGESKFVTIIKMGRFPEGNSPTRTGYVYNTPEKRGSRH
jgi:hypothetical protein